MAKITKPINGTLRLWLQGIIVFITVAGLLFGIGVAYAQSQAAIELSERNSEIITSIRDDISDIKTNGAETRNDISWIKERMQ